MTADVSSHEPNFRLMYRSRDRIPADGHRAELGDLFSKARSNNKANQVTGALLTCNDWFVQTLEGDETVVRSLFARIEQDPRHDSVSLLQAGPAEGRIFSRWSMAQVSEDDAQPDVFLIANAAGISPAASLRPTAQQESFLVDMRSAARTASALPSAAESATPGRGGAFSM